MSPVSGSRDAPNFLLGSAASAGPAIDSNAVAYSDTGSLISVLATPTGCGDASSKEAGTARKSCQRLFQVKWQSMFVDTTSHASRSQ